MAANWKRTLLAECRDIRVLFHEFRRSLLLFVGIIVTSAVIFRFFYVFPGTSSHPSFPEALYGAFALLFLESVLPFPQSWFLQLLFFAIPICGLAAVADGLLRFGAALLDKRQRGQKWEIAMASTYNNHIIVCGLGKVGFRVCLELMKFGKDVVAIEKKEAGHFVEKARADNIPIIIGDARRSSNLRKAGIEKAQAVIPCTDDELANLDIALDAREIKPDVKVVMRMFDADLARRVEKGFGIHTAFSTSALAAPVFATAATGVDIKHSFYLDDTLLSISEILIAANAGLVGKSVADLEKVHDASVVYFERGELKDLRPDPSQVLTAGDRLLVLAQTETLENLTALNQA